MPERWLPPPWVLMECPGVSSDRQPGGSLETNMFPHHPLSKMSSSSAPLMNGQRERMLQVFTLDWPRIVCNELWMCLALQDIVLRLHQTLGETEDHDKLWLLSSLYQNLCSFPGTFGGDAYAV